MNVRLLIQQAYRWAEIIAETGESADSDQLTTGLNLFNKILRRISIDGVEIPLLTTEDFTLVQGQDFFDLDGWTKLMKVQYLLGGVKIGIRLLTLEQYRNSARIQTSSGIPYVGYPQRTTTGIQLLLFFKPSSDYTMTVDGYKLLTKVTLDDDLTGVTEFMQDFLEIALAFDLQQFYQLQISPYLIQQKEMYLKKFDNVKEKRIDMFTHRNYTDDLIYSETPYLNLSNGWLP